MKRKLIATTVLVSLGLVAAAPAFAQPSSDPTSVQGNVDSKVTMVGAQTNLVIGSNNFARNSVGTVYENSSIKGNFTQKVSMTGAQTNLLIGSNNRAMNDVGAFGAGK